MKTLTIIKPIRDHFKHLALASALAAGLGSIQAAIPVGTAGSGTLTFDSLPANTEWSTVSIGGGGGDINSLATMDTKVNALAASGINTQLGTVAADPSGTMVLGQWNSAALRLTTRAGGNAATCIMATLENTSGAAINELDISFTLSGSTPPSEEAGLAGYVLYYSLTGATSSWQRVGVYNALGTVNTSATLSSAWADTATLYVLWVDDNGNGVTDGWWGVDDVSFAKAAPSANILSFGLPGNPAVITGTNIYLTVPDGTIVTALTPTFTMSYGASCTHGVTGDPIVSGVTPVDFTNPVHFIVTSEAPVVTKDYTVQVNFQPVVTVTSSSLNVTAAATGAEILNDAVLVEANHFYSAAAPVTLANGLTFGTDWSHTTPTGLSDSHQRTDTDSHNRVPLLNGTTPFGKLMRSYSWSSYTAHQLNIPGLTPGHTYRLQLVSTFGASAIVSVEGVTVSTAWNGNNQLLTATWIQSPGDTVANVVLTRNGPELETTAYALHDLSAVPVAPTDLAATPLVGEIRLNWTATAGTASYNVKRALTPGGPYPPESVIGTPTGTVFSDLTVANGVTYYYVVSSVNVAGESVDNSNEVFSSPTTEQVAQTITFALGTEVTKTTIDAPFEDLATATSLLPVRYTIHPDDVGLGIAQVDYDTGMVTLLGVPGVVRILANQEGNSAFFAAPEVTQSLTVNQVLPVVIWNNPAAIIEGTALSATQLNATCTVPGAFVYDPPIDTVLPLGSHILSVQFTPDNTVAYSTPEAKTVTLFVGSAEGPTLINVNISGNPATASMNGLYSFDTVASGSASRVAPAAYGGNTWNDLNSPTAILATSPGLLDSQGTATGVGLSMSCNSGPWADWYGLGHNRMLLSAAIANYTVDTPIFTLTGLTPGHTYDLYIASLQHDNNKPVDFTVGTVVKHVENSPSGATDWLEGRNYAYFAGLIPDGTGTIVVQGKGNGSWDGINVNGFQLQDMGGGAAGFGTWASANAPGQTPDQDHDNDGVENGIEYFMGESGSSFTANPGLDGTGTVIWQMDTAYIGSWQVQTSSDLSTWTNVAGTDHGTSVSYTLPEGAGKLFVRLLVTPTL